MTLKEARERQRLYLIRAGYWERPDGWWVGRIDAARPLTDEINTGVFMTEGAEVQADLMVRFVPIDMLPK